jgi:molecular chaperone Hsp31 and glyoxalase 3
LTCTNDLKFSTGNHPVELFVPLLHLDKAGLEVDFCTPTGKAVQLEQWAMPLEGE